MTEDVRLQYGYFCEEIDPKLSIPKVREFSHIFFLDSDHGHDLVTGKSITGMIGIVGSTPVVAISTKQSSLHTLAYGAEQIALKTTVDHVLEVRYFMRSMGIEVNRSTPNYVDNEGVVKSTINPSSPLNRKALALA